MWPAAPRGRGPSVGKMCFDDTALRWPPFRPRPARSRTTPPPGGATRPARCRARQEALSCALHEGGAGGVTARRSGRGLRAESARRSLGEIWIAPGAPLSPLPRPPAGKAGGSGAPGHPPTQRGGRERGAAPKAPARRSALLGPRPSGRVSAPDTFPQGARGAAQRAKASAVPPRPALR
eukprot:scaffold3856_cov276-Prasinococcus_capsulatus_cf.AAC.5